MKLNDRSSCKYAALVLLSASMLTNHPEILSRVKVTRRADIARSKDFDVHSLGNNSSSVDTQKPRPKASITSINLIGERHSATKYMTNHLQECFGDQIGVFNRYTRWKHWFQYDDRATEHGRNYHQTNTSLVVAMFRDPFDWVDSMRKQPYHSPNHFDLDWKEFVTTPWAMDRGHGDKELLQSGSQENATCMHRFRFNEVVPCTKLDRNNVYNGTYQGKTVGVVYELKHDGSGRPYKSILDLRRDKIKNFLGVQQFDGVAAYLPLQYEYMVAKGTSDLISEIEKITGLKAHCKRAPPRTWAPKDLDAEFVEWMNDHVDWEVEKLVGYSRRDTQYE